MVRKALRDRLADSPRLASVVFTAGVAVTQAGSVLRQCSSIHTGP